MARGWLSRAGDRKLGDLAVERHAANATAAGFAEPQRSVAHDNGQRPAARRDALAEFGDAAVGRHAAIRSMSPSENQILPSGPSAIPSGPALAVGKANSAMVPS